eukprot:10788171-Alexandrium_andersonii.AAC.1
MFRKTHHVVDITKCEDFADSTTVAVTMRGIREVGDVFFYSSPCTGGLSWQRMNTEHARRAQCMTFAQRFVDHDDLHWKLWVGFERIACHCHAVGAT